MSYNQTKTIGGTAVSQILGVNPYAGPWDAYNRITLGIYEELSNEAIDRGVRLETPIMRVAEEYLGFDLVPPPMQPIPHSEEFSASVDCVAYTDGKMSSVVEIKTAARYSTLNPLAEHYRLQVQHYLYCLDLPIGYLVGLQTSPEAFRMIRDEDDIRKAINSQAARLIVKELPKDPMYADVVVPRLLEWYDLHVRQGVEPSVDGSDGCKQGLAHIHLQRSGETEMTEGLRSLVSRRTLLKEEIKKMESECSAINNKIKAELGNWRKATSEDWSVTVSRMPGRTSFDDAALKRDHPEMYNSYVRSGREYETLRVTRKGKAGEATN